MLQVEKLKIQHQGTTLIDNISFKLHSGEILALIGESGSGKSLTSQGILQILDRNLTLSGSIALEGVELTQLSAKEMKKIRGAKIAMIFQEPLLSLNPLFSIEHQLSETYRIHTQLSKHEINKEMIKVLDSVEIDNPAHVLKLYPHQLSGGMRQRVMIAMAMSLQPQIIIADEPTSSLDTKTKRIVIELLAKMNQLYQTAIIFVTHDLDSIRGFADRVIIMRQGQIIEENHAKDFFLQPKTDYGQLLLNSLPDKEELKPVRTNNLLNIENLTVKYESNNQDQIVLEGLNLTIKDQSFTSIVGESGSGKSTLARCIMGIIKPTAGKILYKDQYIYHHSAWIYDKGEKGQKMRHEIQMILQDPYASLDPQMRIDKLLSITLRKQGFTSNKLIDQKIKEWFDRCLLPFEDIRKYPHQLSGGKRQRVAIIRGLIQNPRLLICDEITSALDSPTQKAILELILQLKKEFGFTVLFISHDMKLVEHLSDAVYRIEGGEITKVNSL